MLFESWYEMLRVFATTVVVYVLVVAIVRLLGKRTTAKMNNYRLDSYCGHGLNVGLDDSVKGRRFF